MARDKASIIKNAQKFTARGQIDKALAEYQKLLDDNPSDGNTHNIVGDLHLKNNDKAKAVSSYFKAADLFKAAGFSLKAMALYKKILNIDNTQVDSLLSLATLNAERGLVGNANENYVAAADIYLKGGNVESALGIYEKMVELSPSNAVIRAKVADLYIKMGLREKACKEYLACADMLVSDGKLEKAETAFRRVKEIMPKHPHAYLGLCRALKAAGREDEARQELRQAQDAVSGNPQLEYVYAKAASDAGFTDEALGAIGGILRAEPTHSAANRLKAEILLAVGRGVEAWDEIFPVTEELAGQGSLGDAIAVLEPFTEDEAHRRDALLRLATMYRNAGEAEKAGKTFKKLGTLFEEAGQTREAQRALTEAAQLLPEDELLKEKVAAFAAQVSEPAVAVEEAAAEAPAEEAAAAVGGLEGPGLEIEEEFDFGTGEEPAEAEAAFGGEEPEEPVFEIASSEEKTVHEVLLEVEVFARYGQLERALECLEDIKERDVANPEIYVWLQKIHGERGDHDAMVSACEEAVRLLIDAGEQDRARETVEEAFRILPDDPRLGAARETLADTGAGVPPGEAEPAAVGLGGFEIEEPSFGGAEEETVEEEGFAEGFEAGEAATPDQEGPWGAEWSSEEETDESWVGGGVGTSGFGDRGEEEIEAPETEAEEPAAAVEFGFPDEATGEVSEGEPFEEISDFDIGGEEFDTFEAAEAAAEPQEPQEGAELSDFDDDMAEAEFYAQQGLNDEAMKIFDRLLGVFPESEQLKEKIASLGLSAPETAEMPIEEVAEAAAEAEPVAEESFASVTWEDEGEGEGESAAIPEEDPAFPEEEPAFLEAAVQAEAVEPVSGETEVETAAEAGEYEEVFEPLELGEEEADEAFETLDLFGDEEEVEEARERPEGQIGADEELAEIFNAFKQGVEKELEEGDFETHYNLGIAYKEMGLIDDAIREFQIVNKSPELNVDGASMLGICYIEKGLPELAVEQYRRALETISEDPALVGEDAVKAMKFDLANALELAGEAAEARKLFVEVYAEDAKFRDVASRIDSSKGDAQEEDASNGPKTKKEKPAAKRDRVSYI